MQTATTTALLDQLRADGDPAAWQEFDARYRPILFAFAIKAGLSAEDAADVAQEALTKFVREYRAGRYDRSRGRLRSWLYGIARHCVGDARYAAARRRERRGLSAIVALPGEAELSAQWDREHDRAILVRALAELREETKTSERVIRAFEMLALDQLSPSDVAQALNMSYNDVCLAKHRCLKRLRAIVEHMNAAYEIV